MFSTYYAIDRAFGRGDPLNHCALNVSLWHEDLYYWGFTERGRETVERGENFLNIGTSDLCWNDGALEVSIDELNWPRMNRVQGKLRIMPTAITDRCVLLDTGSWHRWWPIAPHARIEVTMKNPACRWKGDAYFDHNAGQAPLERSFSSWTWSRARIADRTAIFYDLKRRDQADLSVALEARADGSLVEMPQPPQTAELPKTLWRLPRTTRTDSVKPTRVLKTIEDGPFYARSLLRTSINRKPAVTMQETLSLERLRQAWIRYLVLYRNPRALTNTRRNKPAG